MNGRDTVQTVHLDALDDMELVRRSLRKDGGAFGAIMQRHNRRLYRIARSVVRNDSEAEDVVQEAYVSAFSNLATFRGESSLATWLSRIALNEALGRIRRRRRTVDLAAIEDRPPSQGQLIPFPHSSAQLDPERKMAQCEIQLVLERAIDGLPDDFRTVLVARVIEGLSIEETAQLLDLHPGTVKTRLNRARKLLRKVVERNIGPILTTAFPFEGRRCEQISLDVLQRLGLSP